MSTNATRIAALFAACLAAATTACAPAYTSQCAPQQTVSVDYDEQVCYADGQGYEACRWVPKTYAVTIPATCEAAVTIRATPLIRR